MKKINVGIIGFGTIGAGVVKALKERRSLLMSKEDVDINIAWICDKDIKSKRPVRVDKNIMTTSFGKVLYDTKVDIVIELIGGINPAKDIIMEALRKGKHVVTANKALLSHHAGEIFGLAGKLGLKVGFEASVGGGIPIIRSIREGFVADDLELIYGIINGTSNFILTKMLEERISFEDALRIAQSEGYAERDPFLDISGGDSAHKLSILALLGFGVSVKPSDIYTEGISHIEQDDIEYSRDMGYSIKLLAIAKRSGDELELRVHPTLIPRSHLLSNVSGVFNAVFLRGDLVGDSFFYGRGAGADPTSSAVVSDIVSIAKNISCCAKKSASALSLWENAVSVKAIDSIRTRYYLKLIVMDKPGVLAAISGILGKHNISISSVSQKERRAGSAVPVVMMTHEAREKDMRAALRQIKRSKNIARKFVCIRMESLYV